MSLFRLVKPIGRSAYPDSFSCANELNRQRIWIDAPQPREFRINDTALARFVERCDRFAIALLDQPQSICIDSLCEQPGKDIGGSLPAWAWQPIGGVMREMVGVIVGSYADQMHAGHSRLNHAAKFLHRLDGVKVRRELSGDLPCGVQ